MASNQLRITICKLQAILYLPKFRHNLRPRRRRGLLASLHDSAPEPPTTPPPHHAALSYRLEAGVPADSESSSRRLGVRVRFKLAAAFWLRPRWPGPGKKRFSVSRGVRAQTLDT